MKLKEVGFLFWLSLQGMHFVWIYESKIEEL